MELDFKMPEQLKSLKQLFKKNKNNAVGVDVGSNSIKVVQLARQKKQLVLKNYALTKINYELSSSKAGKYLINDTAGEVVKNIFSKLKITNKELNLAIPGFASLVTVINLEAESEKEAQEIMTVEAPKFIPMPLEEVVYDWQIINDSVAQKTEKIGAGSNLQLKTEKEGSNLKNNAPKGKKAVLVAIMKEVSRQYEKTFGLSGYKINSLEIDSFSLIRSLIGESNKNYIILDIGGKVCNIIFAYHGNLIISKSINVAGYKLTEAMARSIGVDSERAEKMKIQQGLNVELKQLKAQVYDPLFGTIVDEVKKSIKIFKENHSDTKVEGIILSGGTSKMIGLDNYFSQNLEMKIFMGNPWSRINYPKELEDKLIKLGPSFAVAVGLAMLGLEKQ